jgi:hypothetical protein
MDSDFLADPGIHQDRCLVKNAGTLHEDSGLIWASKCTPAGGHIGYS